MEMINLLFFSFNFLDIVYSLKDVAQVHNSLFFNTLYHKTCVNILYFVFCDLNLKESEMLYYSLTFT